MKSKSLLLLLFLSYLTGAGAAVSATPTLPPASSSQEMESNTRTDSGQELETDTTPASSKDEPETGPTEPSQTDPSTSSSTETETTPSSSPEEETSSSSTENAASSQQTEMSSSSDTLQTATETATAKPENQSAQQIPIYRLYHPGRRIHLYTKNQSEYLGLASKGWNQEGLAWNAALDQGDMVYRLYHPTLQYHFYTKNTNEYALLAKRGWQQEGRAFNSYGDIPIYRLYNPSLGKYLYTRNTSEYTSLEQKGWKKEGIAFYGLASQGATPNPPININNPGIYQHPEYGNYVNALEFGADKTGQVSSSDAFQRAIQFAHAHKAALYLGEGEFYITQSILLDYRVSDVTAIFGAGMNKTKVRFDWNQATQANNSGILVKELNNKLIGDLTIQYTGEYYRANNAYFGLIDGIQLDHTDNTTVQRVNVSGANRSGVRFGSIRYYAQNVKDSILTGNIDPKKLDLPENNRIVNSHIHRNRVAGVFGTFQKNLVVSGNVMAYNGHPQDGNAGYGFALGVGSYNDGVQITNNTTRKNYRKGIDAHDGDNILIQNNKSEGDRLFGIGIVARTFAMRNITIKDNLIVFDPVHHVFTDDTEPNNVAFKEFWAIDLQTNYDNVGHYTNQAGQFVIQNNTVRGLQDNPLDQNIRINAIRFGFHDHHPYNVQVSDNKVFGTSADRFILLSSKSQSPGNVTVNNNQATIPTVGRLFGVDIAPLPKGSNLTAQNNTLNGKLLVPKTNP